MAVSREFVDYVLEQLSSLGGISTKRMFGCVAFMKSERMFALINAEDRLYVKVDNLTRPQFEMQGGQPFTYLGKLQNGKRKEIELSFHTVPDSAFDDPDELLSWAKLGVDAAVRTSLNKKQKGKQPNK